MIHIGEFARLGQVSMRMLRHYDQLGLLTPDRVDPWTGYRSYSAGQLARLNRIVALKGLGFPLTQVARLLDDGRPDPTPVLLADLALLGRLGVDRVVMTCNTSHAFLPPADQLPSTGATEISTGASPPMARNPTTPELKSPA